MSELAQKVEATKIALAIEWARKKEPLDDFPAVREMNLRILADAAEEHLKTLGPRTKRIWITTWGNDAIVMKNSAEEAHEAADIMRRSGAKAVHVSGPLEVPSP